MGTCDDGAERLCRIRGKMLGREWVNVGDVVLVSVRSFEPDKADICWKYQAHEVDKLRRWGLVNVGANGTLCSAVAMAPTPSSGDIDDDDAPNNDDDGSGSDLIVFEDI